MKKGWRWTIAIALLLVIFGASFGWDILKSYFVGQYISHYKPQPLSVSTAIAQSKQWQPSLASVGTFEATNGTEVNAKVAGQVVAIYFNSGILVKKGDPLVKLSSASIEQTILGDQAQLQLATLKFQQQQRLYKKRVTSKSALEEAEATFLSAQATLKKSQVDLNNKIIRAPFSGKLGISQVDLGKYIQPGDALVSLQALDALFVNFALPEQYIKDVNIGQTVELSVAAYPDQVFSARVSAIGSRIDANTRNISVQATVSNPHHLLYPGGFAAVKLILPMINNVITIPQTAVTYSLYGDSVYIVKDKKDNKSGQTALVADQKFVKLGARKANEIEVLQGIQAGDQVVSSGQLKLRPGAIVKIDNSVRLD